MTTSTLTRAQTGDGDAFQELVEPFRRELHAHCYRILGSFHDAEDVLQETLVSAWQAMDRFDGRSLRTWLYRIATNRSLNFLRDAGRRPQISAAVRMPGDPSWLEPIPDVFLVDSAVGPEARYAARESIGLAFVASLQNLPAQQRAVLVLRDVLGFSAAETAEILATTTASVNSALQRARAAFRPEGAPDRLTLPRSAQEARLVARFVEAFEAGDVTAIAALLTRDARVTMPPEPIEFQGPIAIAAFFRTRDFLARASRLVLTRANGQPALGYYVRTDDNGDVLTAGGLLVLDVRFDGIAGITRFGDLRLFTLLELPRTLT